MGQLLQARTRPKPKNINPNPKTTLKPKSCPKTQMKSSFCNVAKLFGLYFCVVCAPKTKSTSKAEILSTLSPNQTRKLTTLYSYKILSTLGRNFVNFRPEPDPKTYNCTTIHHTTYRLIAHSKREFNFASKKTLCTE